MSLEEFRDMSRLDWMALAVLLSFLLAAWLAALAYGVN